MALEYELAALVALIGLSGFFSGLEVALVGTSQATVERLVKDNVKGAKTLQKLKSNPGLDDVKCKSWKQPCKRWFCIIGNYCSN